MTESTVDKAIYHDNFVTLAGFELVVSGPIRAGLSSEFSAGLKIGQATYDERLHAFWIVLDDFSGGFGHRRLDIREELGTFWQQDAANAPDLRRARDMTLSPPFTLTTPVAAGNNDMNVRNPSYPFTRNSTFIVFGFGSSIYTSADGLTEYTCDNGETCVTPGYPLGYPVLATDAAGDVIVCAADASVCDEYLGFPCFDFYSDGPHCGKVRNVCTP